MSSTNRAAVFAKVHKVLKKHYKPVSPPERPLLEHLLYACLLENSTFESADEAIAKLQELFFNWNEVRVTSTTELSEVMSMLADPREGSARLKKALQAVFESHYTFDIDFLKKLGQGKALKEFEKFSGVTPFGMAYITQHGLGGHSIPTNKAALEIFVVVDAITDANAEKSLVPGLERAIPKTKGVEFASLLHQFAVDFAAGPNSTQVRGYLQEIDSQAKERMRLRAAKSESQTASDDAKKKPAKEKPSGTVEAKPPVPKPPKKKTSPKEKTTSEAASSEPKKSSTKGLTKKKPR